MPLQPDESCGVEPALHPTFRISQANWSISDLV
jgi:hypothetical protein